MASKSHTLNFQALFESIPGLYLVLAKDLTIVAVSDAYLQATKTERQSIIGRSIFNVFPDNPDDPTATGVSNLQASLQRVLKNRTGDTMAVQQYDIRLPESEGGGFAERYWSPHNSPVFDERGDIEYIIHRVEDVTEFIKLRQRDNEQLKANETLRSRAEQMESEVYQRAQEVAEANRKLRELDQIKNNFFANVSHELRTPLTLILGPITQMLASNALEMPRHQELVMVERNAKLLLKQVNDLLDVAKLDAGELSLDYARVDAAQMVRLLESDFESLARNRSIGFSARAPEVLFIEADGAKLQRILLNLLSNAFKFTPGEGKIELALEQVKDQALFRITDTGPGIPYESREDIFERFHQLDGSARRVAGGTGLGLAIVKELVALHRGHIQVSDNPDGGAAFTVMIPLKSPHGVTIAKASSTKNDGAGVIVAELNNQLAHVNPTFSTPTHNALVLIVEDNSDMQAYVASLLSHYRVEVASNGKEGLEKVIQLIPDLIVSDVMMPQMSGDEMVHALLSVPQAKDIPLLMLTAKADDTLKMMMLKEGARDYIIKPFSPEELRIKAKNLIAKRRRIIAERELLITQLTKSNQDLERFAYAAAHDLKTPLRSIDNLSQWIEEEVGDSLKGKSREHMQKMRDQVRRMEKLLNDMLEYSRIDSKLDEQRTEMTTGLALMEEIIALITPPKGFSVHHTKDFDTIYVQRMPLQQILHNLIVNAIKHHDKAEGHIEVNAEDGGTQLIFTVRDDGPGIASEYHQKIFEMFQTLKPRFQSTGSGMGLAMVKKLVTMHGGEVTIESQPGRGACFRFSWPKTQGEAKHVQ